MVICPGRGADLHMTQLMPLPPTISCSSKSRLVLPFWYQLTRVFPDKIQRAAKTVLLVAVLVICLFGNLFLIINIVLCGVCGRGIGNTVTSCQKWVHRKCSGIKGSMFKVMMKTFVCRGCLNPVTSDMSVDGDADAAVETRI